MRSPRTRKDGPERTLRDPREQCLHRCAKRSLNGRLKPLLGAAGPGTVFDVSFARFGVAGARSTAQHHGEVLLCARRRGLEAQGRVAKFTSARVGVMGDGVKRGEVCSLATCGVFFDVRWRSRARRRTICSPAARRGAQRVSAWAKSLGREVCSPASWRCVPRRVSAGLKAQWPGALSTPGGLGRYKAAQCSVAFGSGCGGQALPGIPRKAPLCPFEIKACGWASYCRVSARIEHM